MVRLKPFPSSHLCTRLIYALFTFYVFSLRLATFSCFSTAQPRLLDVPLLLLFVMTVMNLVNCLMFTSQGRIVLENNFRILQFYTRTRSKRKNPDWRRNRNLPAPAPGSAMKAVFEMSQGGVTRCTCGRFLAAFTFLVVSGRRKYALWLHKRLHSRLLALYLYVAWRIGAHKPDPVATA